MAPHTPRAVRLWALAFSHRKGGPPFYGFAIGGASTLVVLATYSCTIDILCLMFGAIHEDTGLSRSTLSAFMLVGTWTAGALQPFTGRLVDRLGARVVGCCSMGVHALGLATLALARGAPGLVIGFTLVRVGGIAGTLLSQDSLLSKWFVAYLGRVVAAQRMVMGLLGVSAIPLAVGHLVPRVGWRGTYALLAIPLVLVCPMAAAVLVATPEDAGLLPDGKGDGSAQGAKAAGLDSSSDAQPLLELEALPVALVGEEEAGVAHTDVVAPEQQDDDPWLALLAPAQVTHGDVVGPEECGERHQWTTREAMGTRTFWALLCLCFSACCTTGGVTAHNSLIAADAGLPLERMTQLVLIPSAVAYLAINFLWGHFLDKGIVPMRGLFTGAFTFIASAAACAMGMLAAGQAGRHGVRDALACIFGLLYGAGIGSTYYLFKVVFAHFYGRTNVGAIMGMANFSMFLAIGAGPVMYGLCRDSTGAFAHPLRFRRPLRGAENPHFSAGSYSPILRVSCVMCGVNAAAAWLLVKPPLKSGPPRAIDTSQ